MYKIENNTEDDFLFFLIFDCFGQVRVLDEVTVITEFSPNLIGYVFL